MARKRAKKQTATRESLHVTLPADVVKRLRSFAGWNGLDVSAVVAEGVAIVMRGFSVRQDAGLRVVEADIDGEQGRGVEPTENGLRPGVIGTEAA